MRGSEDETWLKILQAVVQRSPLERYALVRLGSSIVGQLEEPLGHQRALAFILVLEEYKHISPLLLPKPAKPGPHFCIVIIRLPQPQIPPIRSRYEWYLELILCLCYTQGRFMVAKNVKDFRVEPRLMPELESDAAARRKQAKKLAQPGRILLKERRQLK